jgi:RNA polymerase sigma-70 factor, ECF subfamily
LQQGQGNVKTVSAMAFAPALSATGPRATTRLQPFPEFARRCAVARGRRRSPAAVSCGLAATADDAELAPLEDSVTAEKKPLAEGTPPGPPRLVLSSLRGSRDGAHATGNADEIDIAREPMLRARQGDLDAFRVLVEMFSDRVMRVMVSVLHCDRAMAEDLCQEVFLRVHKALPAFDGEGRFAGWLQTIAMNVAITEYRRRRTQKRGSRTVSIDAPLAGTDDLYLTPAGREVDPGERAHQHEFLARVRECVQQLPDEFRAAVVLRDMESLSYEEIAVALGLAPGTVRSRIHRGRLLLQDMLREFDR